MDALSELSDRIDGLLPQTQCRRCGYAGCRPYADAIAAACRRTGALLIADEVQCGLGRTGRMFYSGALGLQPDLMALGKALGAGVPIGAAMFSDRVAD